MVGLVIWVVVGVLVLSFFGISLQALIDDPTTQDNFSYVFSLVEQGWDMVTEWFVDIREEAQDLIKKD